ncbi:MAG: hypothetical protein LC730_04755 [Acidobacteria bacterium]|nr:hypothetical protein [Acidobacteriota bacterium]MCA1608755.1 hypothetical protein [Acidobacteriota bacterium]
MLCIDPDGCEDLEVRKVYELLPRHRCATDAAAQEDNYLRVIHESGEGYLYPARNLYPIEIAANVRESLLQAA